jgi:TetR/AcrR family transcriptional regulator, repressor for uid operon
MTLIAAPPTVTVLPTEVRLRDAALVCIGRFGLAKTTVDDIAREAGCSRATLYRYFDGKPAIVRAALLAERERIVDAVVDTGRAAPTFADAVVDVVVTGARELRDHDALQFLLAHEPEAVLGYLAFVPGDRLLTAVGDAIAPAFDRWLSPTAATRAGDWLARLVRSYVLMPHPPVDFTDPIAARAFLEQLVIPGLAESREPS